MLIVLLGVIGCIWTVLWFTIVKQDPTHDDHISKEELKYIQNSLSTCSKRNENATIPWKAICTSKVVLAICMAHTAAMWGLHTLLLFLPKFLKGLLKYEI